MPLPFYTPLAQGWNFTPLSHPLTPLPSYTPLAQCLNFAIYPFHWWSPFPHLTSLLFLLLVRAKRLALAAWHG